MQEGEAAPAAPSKLFPGGFEPSAKGEAPAGGSALQLAGREAGTWVVLSQPGRWGRAHLPRRPSKMRLLVALRLVLDTLGLVKIREDVSRPNFISKWRGLFLSPPSLPHPSPSALLRGKKSFLVKPCNRKAELSAGGADPASLRVRMSSRPRGAGLAHVGALADGGLRSPAGSRVAPQAQGWLRSSSSCCRAAIVLVGETEAAAEHLFHLPKPHLRNSLRNPLWLSWLGVTRSPLGVLSAAARG